MQPNPHDETADRAAEERSEDDGMPEHRAKARDPARWAAERGVIRDPGDQCGWRLGIQGHSSHHMPNRLAGFGISSPPA